MVQPQVLTTCFVLVQVANEAQLRARLPTAVDRGRVLVEDAVRAQAVTHAGQVTEGLANAWLVTFPDALRAVQFAAGLQIALLAAPWQPTLLVRPESAEVRGVDGRLLYRGLRARAVVHSGRLSAVPDGRISGPGLYQAARILAVTHGGQVLVSSAAHRSLHELGADLGPRLTLLDLGELTLIGVDGIGPVLQAVPRGLEERRFPRHVPPTTNLHTQDESTLGRDGDVQAITDLVRMGIRLVTMVGPPGVGKSRTCRLSARSLAREAMPGGVWWVRPGEPNGANIVRCVANALSIPLEDARSVEEAIRRLGSALASRGRMVIVLDHLTNGHRQSATWSRELREVLIGWMSAAPQLTFVVNTDVRFSIPGEVLYVLLPLVSNRDDSVRLFLDRARAVDQDVQGQDPQLVAELVESSGGLPLSIRLLAGIVDRFPVERQLDWFRAGDLSADNLLAVVLSQLDEAERDVLAACCALPGAFEPSVLSSDDPESAYGLVERLELRGLVRRANEPEAPEILRYLVEEEVRRQVLLSLPVEEYRSVRDVRARLLLSRCEQWQQGQYERDRPELVAWLAVDWDGLVEVVRIGLEESREDLEAVMLAARAVLVMRPVLEARGPAWVAAELLDAVCRRLDVMIDADPAVHLRVLVQRAQAIRRVGQTASAFGDLERAEAMGQRWSDVQGLAQCAVEAGRAEYEVGSTDRALLRLEEGARLFRESEEPGKEAVALTYLGAVMMAVGQFDVARRTLTDALERLRTHHLRLHECRALGYLALLHRRLGESDASRLLYTEAISVARECGLVAQESRWLAELGLLELNLERIDDARASLARADRVARTSGDTGSRAVVLRDLGLVALVDGRNDEATEALVAAVAIHRDRGEPGEEGADHGMLAWVHHLQGRLDEAAAGYRTALDQLEAFGDLRLGALFGASFAACQAERGDIDAALVALDHARRQHAESGDPQIGAALALLELLVTGCRLEYRPDPVEAAAFGIELGATRERMANGTRVPAFARLAWKRLDLRLASTGV